MQQRSPGLLNGLRVLLTNAELAEAERAMAMPMVQCIVCCGSKVVTVQCVVSSNQNKKERKKEHVNLCKPRLKNVKDQRSVLTVPPESRSEIRVARCVLIMMLDCLARRRPCRSSVRRSETRFH